MSLRMKQKVRRRHRDIRFFDDERVVVNPYQYAIIKTITDLKKAARRRSLWAVDADYDKPESAIFRFAKSALESVYSNARNPRMRTWRIRLDIPALREIHLTNDYGAGIGLLPWRYSGFRTNTIYLFHSQKAAAKYLDWERNNAVSRRPADLPHQDPVEFGEE